MFQNYVARHGQKSAETFSAGPEYFEHQTRLAFDLKHTSVQLVTGQKEQIRLMFTHMNMDLLSDIKIQNNQSLAMLVNFGIYVMFEILLMKYTNLD